MSYTLPSTITHADSAVLCFATSCHVYLALFLEAALLAAVGAAATAAAAAAPASVATGAGGGGGVRT